MAAHMYDPTVAPKGPFVIVTRKGGFPAATLFEAMRVVRPLMMDDRTTVTDANGTKYTARGFLVAAEVFVEMQETASGRLEPKQLKDWAAATADIDLDGDMPPGWSPPTSTAASAPAVTPTKRPSGPARTPASTRSSSSNNAAARSRSTSDRRQVDRRPVVESKSKPLMVVIMIAVVVVIGLAVILMQRQQPVPAVQVVPVVRPTTPTQVEEPHPVIRPEDRPLPTYMR